MNNTELTLIGLGIAADHSLDVALRARADGSEAEAEAAAKRTIALLRLESRIKRGAVKIVEAAP